jgi:hypothetical protein
MDEHRHKIFIILVFFITILHIITVVVTLQEFAFHQHYSAMMMMMLVFIMETNIVTKEIFVWSYELASNFMERQLWANYSTKMFKQRTRLILKTFYYLCTIIIPSLGRAYSHMRSCISIKT